MRKKSLVLLLVLVMTIGMFNGCGKEETQTSTNSKTDATSQENTNSEEDASSADETQEEVKLDILWFADGVETEAMQKVMNNYKEENPHVEFNMIEIAYSDLDSKLKTMIAGGTPPAIARVTNPGLLFDHAQDISEFMGGYDQFTEQYMDSLEPYYTKDGGVYAVPMDVTANGLIYNKTLFDQAGVAIPSSPDEVWTWEEFEQAVIEVKENSDAKYGLLWDVTPHRWSTLLYEFGGSIINEAGDGPAINNEQGVAALNYFKKLHDTDIIPKSVWLGGENPNNLFRSGTAVAHLSGNWMLSNYRDITDFEWGVTYAPKQATRSSVPGGKYMMPFKNTGVEEEAMKFLAYFAQAENTGQYCSDSLFISPRLDNSELDYEYGKEMFAIFSNELANTPPAAAKDWSRQDVMPVVNPDITDAIKDVLMGEAETQEALDKVAELITETIEAQ